MVFVPFPAWFSALIVAFLVVEQNARDAAGKVHKIVVVLQLVFKGGIRQQVEEGALVNLTDYSMKLLEKKFDIDGHR